MALENNDYEELLNDHELSNHSIDSFKGETLSIDSEAEENLPAQPSKTRKKYIPHSTFKNREDFDIWWSIEKSNWRNPRKTHTYEYWNCKFSRRDNYSCDMALKIIFLEAGTILVEITEGEHNHNATKDMAR